jgi:hypothetical protein
MLCALLTVAAAAAAGRYAENLPQLESGRKISPNPADWRCDETGVTENLWLNLSTGHIGSGRAVSWGYCYCLTASSNRHAVAESCCLESKVDRFVHATGTKPLRCLQATAVRI